MSSIGIMHVELKIIWANSLKDKRKVLTSIKSKLRKIFNLSIIESGYQEKWNRSLLSIVLIADLKKNCAKQLAVIEEYIIKNFSVEMINCEKEYLQ